MNRQLPRVVIDTNVVLDWLVFRNAEFGPLEAALLAGQVEWIGTDAMKQELGHVLGRASVRAFDPDADMVWAAWGRHCVIATLPAVPPMYGHPRCTDPDDQMFIDLAIESSATWLLSRDRAVLKLAAPLRKLGVRVITPRHWSIDLHALR